MEDRDKLESLLLHWDAGELSEQEVNGLRDWLKSSAEARSVFLRHQMLNAALRLESAANPGLPATDAPEETTAACPSQFNDRGRSNPSSGRWRGLLIAAGLLIGVLAARLCYVEFSLDTQPAAVTAEQQPGDPPTEARSHGVAIVTRLVDARWGTDQTPLQVGDAIEPGRLHMTSGWAQVEFFCGATVVVEAPAQLQLQSATHAKVIQGRLRVQVPPAARGFSLDVNDMRVVDLGTEFGLSVSPEEATVQVFDGEVELHRDFEVRKLIQGQAVSRASDGSSQDATADASDFTDIAALASRDVGRRDERYEHWKRWSAAMRQDPRLITYYAFDDRRVWNRRLTCSIEPANTELDGAIVGARRVTGRWPMKGGLEFKQPGDRVRVHIPGEFRSLTFACWVRIDSLDRTYNSLFLTDSYDRGEPHWQILKNGQLYFSVRPRDRGSAGPQDFKALSPPFWNASLSGRWVHLATVYNVDSQTITHFLNGTRLSRHAVPERKVVPTHIGTASIGNWSLPTKPDEGFAIRNLNGRMDSFMLFSAALSEEEIRGIYDNSKP